MALKAGHESTTAGSSGRLVLRSSFVSWGSYRATFGEVFVGRGQMLCFTGGARSGLPTSCTRSTRRTQT